MADVLVYYIGNFSVDHSTETHVAMALRDVGARVTPVQENTIRDWAAVADSAIADGADMVLWTKTWNVAPVGPRSMIHKLRDRGIPTAGFHLDRWWGLNREPQITDSAFFECDIVFTADGGHPRRWRDAGVNHVWMPPAVARHETERHIEPDGRFGVGVNYDVAFVGSWQTYHDEWPWRRQMVEHLLAEFRGRFRPVCCDARGQDLANIYGSGAVIVGDSCMVGDDGWYWSDRIPETLGRGGFLIHPDTPGLDTEFKPGEHLVTVRREDHRHLDATIREWLDRGPDARRQIGEAGRQHVRDNHLYEHRMRDLLLYVEGARDLSDAYGPVAVINQGASARFDIRRHGDGIVLQEVWNRNEYGLGRGDVAGKTILDIGANIGDFTIWCLAAGAAKVWAYEPDPANRAELMHNLELNGLTDDPRVVVVAEAVHDATGDVFLGDVQGRVHVIDAPARLTDPSPTATARHVDEVMIRVGDVDIAKIDCEGCEHRIIPAIDPGQLRRIGRIVMEFHSGPDFGGEAVVPGSFGRLVTKLAAEGEVHTVGRPLDGGMIHWRRY